MIVPRDAPDAAYRTMRAYVVMGYTFDSMRPHPRGVPSS